MDFGHQPIDVFRTIRTEIHPHRYGNQGGQSVHQDKAQIGDFAADTCGNENGGAQAGQETGDEQHPVAVFVELFLHLGVTLGRHYAGNGLKVQNAVPPHASGNKHQAVARQYAEHTDQHHHMRVGLAQTGNHAAGNQCNVFGDRHAETACNQHEEHGGVTVLGEKGF